MGVRWPAGSDERASLLPHWLRADGRLPRRWPASDGLPLNLDSRSSSTTPLAGDASAALDELAGLALRRNPRRAHLLVSRVLGKHLPVSPASCAEGGRRSRRPSPTAAAPITPSRPSCSASPRRRRRSGRQWRRHCQARSACSRRAGPGHPSIVFAEEHSHAVGHRVLASPAWLERPRPVVLVDDELSSGRTAINTIRALHQRSWHPGYVVAALLDLAASRGPGAVRPAGRRARGARDGRFAAVGGAGRAGRRAGPGGCAGRRR